MASDLVSKPHNFGAASPSLTSLTDIYKVCPEARGRCKTVSQRKRDRDCYMWEMIVEGVGLQEWNSMTRLERLRFIQHFRRCGG
jgi:hypothetical protein